MAEKDIFAYQDVFRKYAHLARHELSAVAFANIFLWKDFFSFRFDVIDEQLCVFAENEVGCFLYLPPLGECVSEKALGSCFRAMEKVNRGSGVSRIENVEESQLPFFAPGKYNVVLKSRDYCYEREAISGYKGNAFKDKRNAYNSFVKSYPAQLRPFEPGMKAACLALYERWAADRRRHHPDDVFGQMLDDNRIVHQRAMEFYKELGLIGRVVEVEGRVVGYTFGYPLHDEMFCVLVEVTDRAFKGMPAYIFREFCRDKDIAQYRYINAMDDFAMPDLARVKMSYQPVKLVPAYIITLISK